MTIRYYMVRVALGAAILGCSIPARAESLKDAFLATLQTNSDILASEISIMASEEDIAISKSASLPQVSTEMSSSLTRRQIRNDTSPGVPALYSFSTQKAASLSVRATQLLYDGGATRASINQAEFAFRAAKEQARSSLQTIFQQAATAFTDTVRDRAILELRRSNVNLIARQLEATKERFSVGEITQTDVAVAEARLAGAKAEYEVASANLDSTVANYLVIVGRKPGRLGSADLYKRFMPSSLSELQAIASRENPDLVKAEIDVLASRENVKASIAAMGPRLEFSGTYSLSRDIDERRTINDLGISTSLSMPLYSGGQLTAVANKSKLIEKRSQVVLDSLRLQVRSQATATWSAYKSVVAQLKSIDAQIRAEESALRGIREEAKVGQRTVLDVLDATQSFIEARVTRLQVERDITVAAVRILAVMGRLDARMVK